MGGNMPLANSKLRAFLAKHAPDLTVNVSILPNRSYGEYNPKTKTCTIWPLGHDKDRSWVQSRVTAIHELAHHLAPAVYNWTAYNKPGRWEMHGEAWRSKFAWLIHLAINDGLFGEDPEIQVAALNAAVITNCAHPEICKHLTGAFVDLVNPS